MSRYKDWSMEKVIGKLDMKHPDNKRHFKLNYKHMKRLNKSNDSKPRHEMYLYDAPAWTLWLRALLMPWKWRLTVLPPGGKFLTWQYIITMRYGKVREMILKR